MSRAPLFVRCAWRAFLLVAVALLLALGGPGRVQAQTVSTCNPALQAGTAPSDYRDYCWLDFSGYNDGTARGAGQSFRFDLPDGTRISLKVVVDSLSGVGNNETAVTAVGVPSWSDSAFGNKAFMGIPGQPVLYNAKNASSARVNLTNIVVTPPTGGTANYSIIVADGESSNAGETLVFNTNGNDWTRVAQIRNGTSNTFPTQSITNGGQTVTLTGVSGTVGSNIYRSDGNPTTIRATIDGGGLQGVIIGVRYASISVVSQFNGSRSNPADQLAYSLRTGTGTTLVSGATSGTTLTGFAPAVMPTVAASYPFQVVQSMAPGSIGTLASYTTSLTCVNANTSSTTPLPVNQAVNTYTFSSLKYGDSIACTFTSTPIPGSVGGTVYSDANRNGAQDAAESGTGVSGLYVKLVPNPAGTCTGPAKQVATVTAATGAFNFPSVPGGDYCLVLDTNNTLSDITPTLPTGWIGIQNGSGSVPISVAGGTNPEPPQYFGLFNGSRLTGSVFADLGTGGGIANDGARQASEAGIAGLTVRALSGGTMVASAVTAGDGSFTLWLPAGTGTLAIGPAQVPAGQIASGGSAGTTGGTFTRPNLVFTPVAGQQYTGVAIGFVASPEFAPNGTQSALPGTAVFYPHTFDAGSGGQVAFSVSAAAQPAISGWTSIIYRDTNCSATLENTEPVLSAAISVNAGDQVCLIVKQFVPAGAPLGAQNTLTVTAQFTFTNATPALAATVTVTDFTTVGEPVALVLQKRVSNVTRGGGLATHVNATPGDVLLYTLIAQNQGSSPVTTLAIHDSTAAFTTFVDAACPGVLPPGVTACSVSSQPAAGTAGGVRWTFTGALPAGAQLSVTYQVRLDQ
ncbi:CshA/CshB family fibrillar adhesin-related protein [Ramlibacter alkalitolerans]|uniref:DUF11 domain-containing protein n=1 Tax=Ramlibacter alkalitolerans TaxID=2039631 RepID=A0ABS1JRC2_9BURK|nr:CshA/CshB family fibrillar adhesin-related protein [Ramlibacter alkalitolerans]MBL0426120.1 DUF11 domain-containing protein [Ramlibacter alkalitolerans]